VSARLRKNGILHRAFSHSASAATETAAHVRLRPLPWVLLYPHGHRGIGRRTIRVAGHAEILVRRTCER
jgi:hypothetical protein